MVKYAAYPAIIKTWTRHWMMDKRLGDETWQKEGAARLIQEAGNKPLQEYINMRQATVAEWVDLRTIFEVCAKETEYEGEWKVARSVVESEV